LNKSSSFAAQSNADATNNGGADGQSKYNIIELKHNQSGRASGAHRSNSVKSNSTPPAQTAGGINNEKEKLYAGQPGGLNGNASAGNMVNYGTTGGGGGGGASDNENSAMGQSPRSAITVRSSSQGSQRKEKKTSVGYRLGKRKLLFEKRRQISDYALIFAMTGVFLMIIETEFSMSRLYSKVTTNFISILFCSTSSLK
jgi:hypothetical protein